jgi:hypothetical protein
MGDATSLFIGLGQTQDIHQSKILMRLTAGVNHA